MGMDKAKERVKAMMDQGERVRLEPEPRGATCEPVTVAIGMPEDWTGTVPAEIRPRPVRVYLLGASGTGKSTLAKHLANELACDHLTGAVGNVLRRLGITFDLAFRDMGLMDRFQMEIWREQLAMEQPYWEAGKPFVSDRGFDLMAYASGQSRAAAGIVESPLFAEYMRRLKMPGTVVFLMRPHPDVRAESDGRRDVFLSPEWVWKVDGVIEFLLESHRVPYAPVGTASFRDRCRLAARLVSAVTQGG